MRQKPSAPALERIREPPTFFSLVAFSNIHSYLSVNEYATVHAPMHRGKPTITVGRKKTRIAHTDVIDGLKKEKGRKMKSRRSRTVKRQWLLLVLLKGFSYFRKRRVGIEKKREEKACCRFGQSSGLANLAFPFWMHLPTRPIPI